MPPASEAFTLCWWIVCVLGSMFKVQAVFKFASFISVVSSLISLSMPAAFKLARDV